MLCTKTWAPRSWLPNPGCWRAARSASLHNFADGVAPLTLDGVGGTAGAGEEEGEGVAEVTRVCSDTCAAIRASNSGE